MSWNWPLGKGAFENNLPISKSKMCTLKSYRWFDNFTPHRKRQAVHAKPNHISVNGLYLLSAFLLHRPPFTHSHTHSIHTPMAIRSNMGFLPKGTSTCRLSRLGIETLTSWLVADSSNGDVWGWVGADWKVSQPVNTEFLSETMKVKCINETWDWLYEHFKSLASQMWGYISLQPDRIW